MDKDLIILANLLKKRFKEWLDANELYDEFGISTSTQSKLRMKGTIPFHKVGKYIRYKREDINQWLNEAKVV